ncbi:MAG: amine oxidase, partial [Gammaproteobacteria bacterium]
PSPLHLLAAILTASGIPWKMRLRALPFCARLPLEKEQSVSQWLASHGQDGLASILWEPLCLAALNTPPSLASAKVFRRVLQDAFQRGHRQSDMLLPKLGLHALFPEPAREFIERRGGHVLLGQRVRALDIREGRIHGVMAGGKTFEADHVVLAVPWEACLRLIEPHPSLFPIAHALARLSPSPITTVYLRYPGASLPHPFVGLSETLCHWIFDRAFCGQPGLMAAVISGPGEHMAMARERLAEAVAEILARRFPWPPPQDVLVIREKRATFACLAGIESLRPAASTGVRGLWLAGDYTDTGYPSTLEGAVASGVKCAQAMLGETP